MGMIIDGVAASEAIDTSAEKIKIEGLDISSLQAGHGLFNYEHRSPKNNGSPQDLLGAIRFAKKIYNEDDCDDERQLYYWKQIELPFIYIRGELFDDDGHDAAKAMAAVIRYYARNDIPIVVRFSIDGHTIDRDGNELTHCIARDVALTVKPANASCISGLISDPKAVAAPEGLKRNEDGSERLPGVEFRMMPMGDTPVVLDEELVKAMTAGSYNVAPGSLTGGAALQVEDRGMLKNRIRAAIRDWDRKGPLAKHLQKTMTDVNPEFLEKFTDLLEKGILAKGNELHGRLDKAVLKGPALEEAINQLPTFTEDHDQPAQQPVVNPQREAAIAALPDFTENEDEPNRRKTVKITPSTTPTPDIDPTTPQHVYGLRVGVHPQDVARLEVRKSEGDLQQSGMSFDAPNFQALLDDPGVAKVHGAMMQGWKRIHERLRDGTLPRPIIQHIAALITMSPESVDSPKELIQSQLQDYMGGQQEANGDFDRICDKLQEVVDLSRHDGRRAVSELLKEQSVGAGLQDLDAKDMRYAVMMLGAGNVMVPDEALTQHLFAGDVERAQLMHHHMWNDNAVLEDVEEKYGNNHAAVKHLVNNPDHAGFFDHDESAIAPASIRHWMAVADVPDVDLANLSQHLAKNEEDLYKRTAKTQMRWAKRFGPQIALALYFANLVPQLLDVEGGEVIAKSEDLLKNLEDVLPPNPVPQTITYRGNRIVPGVIKYRNEVDHPHRGRTFHILDESPSHYKVVAPGDKSPVAIPKSHENKAYSVQSKPMPFVEKAHVGDEHFSLHSSPESRAMVAGLDLTGPSVQIKDGVHAKDGRPPLVFTHGRNKLFVKGAGPDALNYHGNSAAAETAFYNMSKMFGLQDYVPKTASFYHPHSGELHSAQEFMDARHAKNTRDFDTLKAWNDAGITPKMTIMDYVLGNDDRHDHNFMINNKNSDPVLIDNGYAFQYGKSRPDYIRMVDLDTHTDFTPETKQWIASIKPEVLDAELKKQGMPAQVRESAKSRLLSLHRLLANNRPISYNSLLQGF